ncbi:MAG: malto-oligosyltrehalose synthase [Caulobacteraceae bacterium]
MIPRATYRLQFHKGFTFADATPLAPYLAKLGVSHVYASPIGTARAGSTHGYDQVDPTRINPELGGEDGFRALVAALKTHGLGVILDIVPNHMAVGGADNRWWLDVLENGPQSAYASFFDIDWDPADPTLKGKVLAPFLGTPYAEALAGDAFKLELTPETGQLCVTAYGVHRFPIRVESYAHVLQGDVTQALARYNGQDQASRARLHGLLERQHYKLAWWRTAGDAINWRRFFDVIELAGVRVERPEVFSTLHTLPLRLYAEGLIDGVRVDHVDGLADPAAYCVSLRQALDAAHALRPADAAPGPAYFVVEKILAPDERLSPNWRTDGTTGYDYMNEASALLHDAAGEAELTRHWNAISGGARPFADEERQARLEILDWSFTGQLNAAVHAFHQLALSDVSTRDITAGALHRALRTLLSVFPAYRTYGVGDHAPTSDRPLLATAIERALPHTAPGEAALLQRIADWLLGQGPGDVDARREAARRFQQLSAPVSAKAVEDTAFYRYARLLSRNDVGFDADRLSGSVAHFHQANAERAESFPHAMLTTATHDHKRGEDVRARLAALSEIPEAWTAAAGRWAELNTGLDAQIHPADAYQLYQTLVGAWPLDLSHDDRTGLVAFGVRVAGWQQKALREGKLRSSWTAPDEAYEAACRRFLDQALEPDRSKAFLADLTDFIDRIAPAGALNSLVQTVLRCTVPGVPDLYQGTEFWDLTLVDPDNRRPGDYTARSQALAKPSEAAELLTNWSDGRLKQHVVAQALTLRRDAPRLFQGDYEPLEIRGARAEHILAFLRHDGDQGLLVVAPLRCATHVVGARQPMVATDWWADTSIVMPQGFSRSARNAFTAEEHNLAGEARVADLLASFPIALARF